MDWDLVLVSAHIFTFHNVSINTGAGWDLSFCDMNFTFHNVSINTLNQYSNPNRTTTLHSTMFLLIRHRHFSLSPPFFFTFHNVSINTIDEAEDVLSVLCFTFHNVSINTGSLPKAQTYRHSFTFHNVSINTFTLISTVTSRLLLYIPQCFY